MERKTNEVNYCDHNVEGDAVEGPADCVCRDEVVQALKEIKTAKGNDPTDASSCMQFECF